MANELVPSKRPSKAVTLRGVTAIKKHAAKKHPAKKHPAKKHAEKKHAKKAAKHTGEDSHLDRHSSGKHTRKLLARAYHHLQRASAIISLIEQDTGGDLKILLHHGIELYREASHGKNARDQARVEMAFGLLAASEHLAMAGLYAARGAHPLQVEPPSTSEVEERLEALAPRLDRTARARRHEYGSRLQQMALEIIRRAESAGGSAENPDPHLAHELAMAAEGLCLALEAGFG